MKLPKKVFGINTEKAYEDYLKRPENENPELETVINLSTNTTNPQDYIISRDNNLYIAKTKILHNNNWEDTHKLLQQEKGYMLTLPEMYDFILQLREGIDGKEVLDGEGNKLPTDEIKAIYDEMLKTGDWRSEWLDARFEKINNKFHINYNHIIQPNGELQPQNTEKLEDCIMGDCYVDLIFNSQGLPTKKSTNQKYTQGKNIYYWHPRNNNVALLNAVSVGAVLGCYGDPSSSDVGLGVRKKIFHRK